jgi:hypothetical protein
MSTKLERQLLDTAGTLAGQLAQMHGCLFCLIADLRNTELSEEQDALLNAAELELRASQRKFLRDYAGEIGGGAPGRN